MKLDPVLLNCACRHSVKAYDHVSGSIKIESKLTSTTVFITKRKTIDVICFRGSTGLHDWLFNLSAVPVFYAGRLCHGGFVAAHMSVWRKIKKHIHPKRRTLFCGHSLGGALAELSAAKLHKKHPNLNLVTFGKPNVFFKGFKRPMELDDQISVVCGSDIVTQLPKLFYGPSKSQTMLYFSNSGEDYIDPDKRSIANAVQVRFKDGSSTENITVEYPIGHRRRRQAAKPLLVDKFRANLSTQFDEVRVGGLVNLFSDQSTLGLMAVDELIDMLVLTVD